MNWKDEAIVLSASPHGEAALVLRLLTREHGRHAGLVQGGQSSRNRGLFMPGNLVVAEWSARLPEHLGTFRCELSESYAALFLDSPDALSALASAACLCDELLPEREPHASCFEGFLALLNGLQGVHWGEIYIAWELALLKELGFGLDFSACAASGRQDNLIYVSPRSGRAVSEQAGEPYKDRLLHLPGFLRGEATGLIDEVYQGLRLTGHFLAKDLFHPQGKDLPEPRRRLLERVGKQIETALGSHSSDNSEVTLE